MSTLSDAFLRLQLRAVREQGAVRIMLLPDDDPPDIGRRIYDLAHEQGMRVRVEIDAAALSIVEAPARAAFG